MSISREINLDMGPDWLGYRVKTLQFVPRGVRPRTGLQEGTVRRGMGRESKFIGSGLSKDEATKIVNELNKQSGLLQKLNPFVGAWVVRENGKHD